MLLLWTMMSKSGAQVCQVPIHSPVQVFDTKIDDRRPQLEQLPDLQIGDVSFAAAVLDVHPEIAYQEMNGFGGAMTESCAMNLWRLPAHLRHRALHKLFDKFDGAGFDYIRLPMGASDFSDPGKPFYSYDDTDHAAPDPKFKKFDMSRDEKSFALIREARRINPALRVLITPWSPPAWMKTSKSLVGGFLDHAHYGDLARYFVRAIEEYKARGIPVAALTVQNEPGYADADYPSMGMSDDEQIEFIRDHLLPELRRAGLHTAVYALDHNYDMYSDMNQILGTSALKGRIAGAAYHCYEGDYTEMNYSTKLHPEAPPFLTECTAVLDGNPSEDFAGWMDGYVLGPAQAGATGSMGWNLCLDEKGAPHHNGCDTCRGFLTTDFSKEEPQLIENPEMLALEHVSRFLEPGSRRIEVSAMGADDLRYSAFSGPSGRVNLTVWNSGAGKVQFQVRRDCGAFAYELEPNEAATFSWFEDPFGPKKDLASNGH